MRPIRDALERLPDAPSADLLESGEAYLLVLDLPGATSEGVELTARARRLTIEASVETTVPEGFETRSRGRTDRREVTIPLPFEANATEASARLERGVLEITMPKSTAAVQDER